MKRMLAVWVVVAVAAGPIARAVQTQLQGPAGSGAFGSRVLTLTNGNIVVGDPYYSVPGGPTNAGAAYLYNGKTLERISMLTGSQANDYVGYRLTALSNGHYVVQSVNWHNGSAANAGAATWCSGTGGLNGVVSPANSLVGSAAGSYVGYRVVALVNGHYVVRSPNWVNGGAANAGAATWGDGTRGITGVVSAANSLVGSAAGSYVGGGVTALANGHYVVRSANWVNGAAANAGAATWGDGTRGITGAVSAANSLVGSAAESYVGYSVTELANGNYVVRSANWVNGAAADAGAATWGDGTRGVAGAVSAANSLVGSAAGSFVGYGVLLLSNGNYVILSPDWVNGGLADAGAATWGDGTSGAAGVVSAANSLIGSTANDRVGCEGVALANGHYVVLSPAWDSGPLTDAGAATWGHGTSGVAGAVSAANSLVGGAANDQVGVGVKALANGHYVVLSRYWANAGAPYAGAATWGDGTRGIAGPVSSANSLVGSAANSFVGYAATALSNGNYVVHNYYWPNGSALMAGAATWGDGTQGITGAVSPANSLVGTSASNYVGYSVAELANGNYVVGSPWWDDGVTLEAGAATWCSGARGMTGAVSAANSLVGGAAECYVGDGVTALANGHYVVSSPYWGNGAVLDAGAATWGDGAQGVTGAVSAANSLVGSAAGGSVGEAVMALQNGHYVVLSRHWTDGVTADIGAATWQNGTGGMAGAVSAANSLVGSAANDNVGADGVELPNGNYVVVSTNWDNGPIADAGALTVGDGQAGVRGAVSAANSLIGDVAGGGHYVLGSFDPVYSRLVIGYPFGNRLILDSGPVKENQVITGFTPANGSAFSAASKVGLRAAASSGLPVSFAVASGPGLISGATNLSFTGTGTVRIAASQPGNAYWNPAATLTHTVRVHKADQTIVFPAIPDQVLASRVALAATASSGLPVTFAVRSGPGVITGGNQLSFAGTGAVVVAANQPGNANWNPAPEVRRTVKVSAARPPIAGIMNADFDGDGLADPAVYDERTGTWKVKLSGGGYATAVFTAFLGGPGWLPACADYDGDGLTDPAVCQEATGNWKVLQSGSGYAALQRPAFLGGPGWVPACADYEGDGLADYAVYQESAGNWQAKLSSAGYGLFAYNSFLGGPGWTAACADFDGDSLTDPAVYKRADGSWKVLLSGSAYAPLTLPAFLGGPGWDPVPGDFDGDGLADPAVRKSDGSVWRAKLSGSGYAPFDVPLGL